MSSHDENIALKLARQLQDEHGIAKAIGLLEMAKATLDWQYSVLLMHTVRSAGWKLEITTPEGVNLDERNTGAEGKS